MWDQKYIIWVFLGWNLKKILSSLKSAPSNLSVCKISQKNKKYQNLGPKMHDLGTFGLEFENNFVIFEINTLEFA